MQLIEVNNKKTAKEFLEVARIIYKDHKIWICPLDNEIATIFDPKKNVFFTHGQAIRWILKDDNGNLIGRIAAFINDKKAYHFEQPTGGVGFFECINNKNAAFLLFDQCKQWLSERGMKAMDGPINFGENDTFWGLLVEGFDKPSSYGMNYNHLYYQDFFESYGFKNYYEQTTNSLDLTKPFPERFWKIADWIRQKPGFSFEHFSFKKQEKFIEDFKKVYDEAWSSHENFTPISTDDLRVQLSKAKPILDEELIWYAYHEEQPIAFIVMFPDINQVLKPLHGKLNLLNKLRLFYFLKFTKKIKRARITVMGVSPKFQRHGIESGIFWHLRKVMDKKTYYKEMELSWVGDFNPKMKQLHEAVGGVFAKKHVTYRKLFDENIPFVRAQKI